MPDPLLRIPPGAQSVIPPVDLNAAVESAGAGISIGDADGRFVYANPSFCRITGYSLEQLLGRHVLSIVHPDCREANARAIAKLMADGRGSYVIEKLLVRGDGETIWVENVVSAIPDALGRVASVVSLTQDVTERQNFRQALQDSEARFRALTENSADRTVVLNAGGRVTYASASSIRIFGYDPDEVLGLSGFDFVHPDDVNAGKEVFEKLIRQPGGSAQMRYRTRHKDGRYLWVDCRGYNALDNHSVRGIVLNERDITDEKDMEAQFLRAQRLESVGTLASGVAHDLNNILAPILMSAPMLRLELDEPMRECLVSTIEASAQRGADIVRQILTFTRGIAGERLLLQPLHILKEVSSIAHETFPKNISVVTTYDKDPWPLCGDPTQLHQVLMNLAVNARDAMPGGGTLTFAVEKLEVDEQYSATLKNGVTPGNYVVCSVADTGSGIPAEIRDRIFDPFFTTKDVGKGTGLGLSTVIGIVRAHQGAISVESELGKGTKFSIYLPASPDQTPAEPEISLPEQVPGHGELVLVVDDEKGVLEMSRLILERNGYRIQTAMDGIEGLALYAKHADEVAVVLTDIYMPHFDGLSLVRALRKLSADIPIIGSTGQPADGQEQQLRQMGVNRFLKKPYTKRQLLGVIGELVAKGG